MKLTAAQARVLADVAGGRQIVTSARAKRRRWKYANGRRPDGRAVQGLLRRGVLIERDVAAGRPWRELALPEGR